MYGLRLGFERDLVKDEINKEKRGVTFTEVTEVFERVSLTAPDRRFRMGKSDGFLSVQTIQEPYWSSRTLAGAQRYE